MTEGWPLRMAEIYSGESLRNYGIEIDGVGSAAFAAFIKAETERWSPIVKATGISFE
jgi:hypothetical protein